MTELSTGAVVVAVTINVPEALVGHLNSGAVHTLLEQRPYRHSLPRLHEEPTAPPEPAAGEEALWHNTLESPMIPMLCYVVLCCGMLCYVMLGARVGYSKASCSSTL